MNRILTGVQSTGTPHLGNILGAIKPSIKLANTPGNESFIFIADLHSITQIKDREVLRQNTYSVAATWLAFGLDVENTCFYKQSSIPQTTELMWYLNCFFPYQRLKLAHSFKDKSDRLDDVNVGLFTYPILMAADILLYDANIVPVGKDQLQHLEITRTVAQKFNSQMGNTFIVPRPDINEQTQLVPGIDGRKMSKSANNYIDIFLEEKALRKKIMSIRVENVSMEAVKEPDTCNAFKIYSLLASEDEITAMRNRYLNGGLGFGHVKEEIFQKILSNFETERKAYHYYMENTHEIDKLLEIGAIKAQKVANEVIKRVKTQIGTV